MANTLLIPGESMSGLDQLAEHAGVDVATFIGQSIGLGLNLAEIDAEAADRSFVLFQQADESYRQFPIEFTPNEKPIVSDDMVGFECALDYKEPYSLFLPDLALQRMTIVSQRFNAGPADFLETALFFRDQWTRFRRLCGSILVLDDQDEPDDYWEITDDELFFQHSFDPDDK